VDAPQGVIFDGWESLGEVLITAPLLYALVVVSVRVSGKRTTGQMNNFDWVVTVAIGAIIGSGIVSTNVSVLESALAVLILLTLQGLMTTLTVRSARFDKVVKASPTVLVARGKVLEDACRKERISTDEITSAMRRAGKTRFEDVAWVILENTGEFSIIGRDEETRASTQVVPEHLRA
jgi:uncharacterized membrane protein YcaP (DUF421 family)